MDSGLELFAGGLLAIRVIADRGQWFVEARPGQEHVDAVGFDGWFNLEAWSTCLGAQSLFHDTRPTLMDDDWATVIANSWWLAPQMEYVREHLGEMEPACSAERVDETRVCLSRARRALSPFPSAGTNSET
jgi:hypothetical protein